MVGNVGLTFETFYNENILEYFKNLQESPLKMISFILDIAIVGFLLYYAIKMVRDSRAWQLIKGIAFFVIITIVSGFLNLKILNSILSGIMNWGVIAILIIFQPELRRGLEQLRH
ncbi:MAG: hypothetical protein IKF38_02400 [Clostridia bacterium]|nr:hypothetical protein [Clostridia bacterium]